MVFIWCIAKNCTKIVFYSSIMCPCKYHECEKDQKLLLSNCPVMFILSRNCSQVYVKMHFCSSQKCRLKHVFLMSPCWSVWINHYANFNGSVRNAPFNGRNPAYSAGLLCMIGFGMWTSVCTIQSSKSFSQNLHWDIIWLHMRPQIPQLSIKKIIKNTGFCQ